MNGASSKPIFNKYGPKRGPEYLEVDENEEIEALKKRISEEAPAPGSQLRRCDVTFKIIVTINMAIVIIIETFTVASMSISKSISPPSTLSPLSSALQCCHIY
jgi:hypothetical protein